MTDGKTTKEVVVISFFWMATAVMILFALINGPGNKVAETGGQRGALPAQQSQKMVLEEKIATYESILQNNPNSTQAMIGLGDVYFDTGRLEEAIVLFLKASKTGAPSVHVENDLGLLYLNTKNYDNAIDRFQRALKIDPAHVDSLFYIGVVYQYQGDVEKARQVYENVLSSNPSAELLKKVNKQLAEIKSRE